MSLEPTLAYLRSDDQLVEPDGVDIAHVDLGCMCNGAIGDLVDVATAGQSALED